MHAINGMALFLAGVVVGVLTATLPANTMAAPATLSLETTAQIRRGRALLIDAAVDRQHLWMWGANGDGLIDPTAPATLTSPAVPPAYEAVRARAVGRLVSGCQWLGGVCVWYSSGEMWCWGDTAVHGARVQRDAAAYGVYAAPFVLNASVVSVRQAVCGERHVCVTLDAPYADAVWCHGANDWLQLGGGDAVNDTEWVHWFGTPVQWLGGGTGVPTNSMCLQLAAPPYERHCWGDNRRGQLGRDSAAPMLGIGTGADALKLLTAVRPVYSMMAGAEHWCAQYGGPMAQWYDSCIQCWGDNTMNQLGAASPNFTSIIGNDVWPLETLGCMSLNGGSKPFNKTYTGPYLTCVVWPDDNPVNVSCYGRNAHGEAGHRDMTLSSSTYIQLGYWVIPATGADTVGTPLGVVPVHGMALGDATALVLLETTPGSLTLFSYGQNADGLLGGGIADTTLERRSSAAADVVLLPAPPVPPPLAPAEAPLNASLFATEDRAPPAWVPTGGVAVTFDTLGRRPDYGMRLLTDRRQACFSREQFAVYFAYVEQVVPDARAADGWRVVDREAYPWGGYVVEREQFAVSVDAPGGGSFGGGTAAASDGTVTRVRFTHRFARSGARLQHTSALLQAPNGTTAVFDLMDDGRMVTLAPGVHKLAVRISEWRAWAADGARLRIVFGVQAIDANGTVPAVGASAGVANVTGSSSLSSALFEHHGAAAAAAENGNGGGVRLVSAFERTAWCDGQSTAQPVEVRLMDPSPGGGGVGVVLPPFVSEVFYDPNFAVLANVGDDNDDASGGGNGTTALDFRCVDGRLVQYGGSGDDGGLDTRLLIIIVVAGVGGVALLVAGVALYTNRHRFFGRYLSKLGHRRAPTALHRSREKAAGRFGARVSV